LAKYNQHGITNYLMSWCWLLFEDYDDHEEEESGAMELADYSNLRKLKLMPLLFCVKFWGIEFFAWTDKLL
jgi:hypothetical protein